MLSPEINDWLNQIYHGNSLRDYCWVLGMVVLGFVFKKFLSRIISNLLFQLVKKFAREVERQKFQDLLHKPISWFIMLIILYTATSHLEFPEEWGLAPKSEFGLKMILNRMYLAIVLGTITWICLKIIEFIGVVLLIKAEKTESGQDDQLINFGVEMLKIIVVVFAFFFILGSIFKIDVGSLLAGLGIGGLALALASKESLENLLGSFTIFFDKPFVVGDMVTVGSITGTVEKVGFRSTRIRTLEKSYLTVPNKRMIDAELDNLSQRTFRRVKFNIGVVYGTTVDQIRNIVHDAQKLLDDHPNTNQDGVVRFQEFGASSLDIMVLYYVDTMDYSIYIKVREEINFKIMEIVEKHGSDFAFPTQTIHLEKTNN